MSEYDLLNSGAALRADNDRCILIVLSLPAHSDILPPVTPLHITSSQSRFLGRCTCVIYVERASHTLM